MNLRPFMGLALAAAFTAAMTGCDTSDATDVADDLGVDLDTTLAYDKQGFSITALKPVYNLNSVSAGFAQDSIWTFILSAREITLVLNTTEYFSTEGTLLDSSATMQTAYLLSQTEAKQVLTPTDSFDFATSLGEGKVYLGELSPETDSRGSFKGYSLAAVHGWRAYLIEVYAESNSFSADSAAILGIIKSFQMK